MKKITLMLATVAASFGMVGCDSLSDGALAQHEAAIKINKVAQNKTAMNSDKFEQMRKTDKFAFIADYNDDEKWDIKLKSYHSSAKKDGAEYVKRMKPVIDRDESKDNGLVFEESSQLKYDSQDLVNKSDGILTYINKMELFSNNKATYLKESKDKRSNVGSHYRTLSDTLARYKVKHPSRVDDLSFKHSRLKKIDNETAKALGVVQKEHDASKMNINDFSKNIISVQDSEIEMLGYFKNTNTLLSQLDQSYIRFLKEERVDYFVTLGFAHWCEGDYCGSGTEDKRTIQVSEEVFELADSFNGDLLVNMYDGWGPMDVKVYGSSALVNGLKINLKSIPNSDTHMQYWIDNTFEKNYHRYTVIQNDKTVEDNTWHSVTSEKFWQFKGMVGLPIYSKPYGYYDSEATDESTNILAQTIAEPTMVNGKPEGSNQYGEWRHDSGGNSFFHYYGQYAMISSLMDSNHSYYSHNGGYAYSNYNRNPTRHKATFNANKKSGKVNNKAFAGLKRHSLSRHTRSVRGSGPNSRSRGPGTRGKS